MTFTRVPPWMKRLQAKAYSAIVAMGQPAPVPVEGGAARSKVKAPTCCVEIPKCAAPQTRTRSGPEARFRGSVEEHLCINPASRMGGSARQLNFRARGGRGRQILTDGFGPCFSTCFGRRKVY